jgi:antitoxin (DNA-binding transcriptional repressor) of toxin-antitoxin stability system
MRAVGVKKLKDRLSSYVRLAASGEVVLITDRDKVVAELGPPAATRAPELPDAMLAAMVREGSLSPATGAPLSLPEAPPVASLDEILAELDEDRGER